MLLWPVSEILCCRQGIVFADKAYRWIWRLCHAICRSCFGFRNRVCIFVQVSTRHTQSAGCFSIDNEGELWRLSIHRSLDTDWVIVLGWWHSQSCGMDKYGTIHRDFDQLCECQVLWRGRILVISTQSHHSRWCHSADAHFGCWRWTNVSNLHIVTFSGANSGAEVIDLAFAIGPIPEPSQNTNSKVLPASLLGCGALWSRRKYNKLSYRCWI